MKIIFMGTPDFAIPSLEQLANSSAIDVLAVVTQPDRRRGRGQKLKPSPIKEKALKLNLEVITTANVNKPEFINKLKSFSVEAIVVVAFGQKLGPHLLKMTKYGCINLHSSLLPKYRGAGPIQRAIINGDKITGVTTMYMDEGWDTGDLIYQEEVVIDNEDTGGSLHDKLAEKGAQLLLKTLVDLKKGIAPQLKQDEKKASYAFKIDKKLGEINWNKDAESIYNLVRALNPYPGAYTYYQGDLIKIWQVKVVNSKELKDKKAGEIVEISEKDLVVNTAQGLLSLKKVQLAGKNKMNIKDFLHGFSLEKGKIFNNSEDV